MIAGVRYQLQLVGAGACSTGRAVRGVALREESHVHEPNWKQLS